MAAKQYPLAPSTWGAGVEVPVDHVSQAALFADLAGLRGTIYVDVALEANPLNRSWRVRRGSTGDLPGPVLGEIALEVGIAPFCLNLPAEVRSELLAVTLRAGRCHGGLRCLHAIDPSKG